MDTTQGSDPIPELLADLLEADPADAPKIADDVAERLGLELDEPQGDEG